MPKSDVITTLQNLWTISGLMQEQKQFFLVKIATTVLRFSIETLTEEFGPIVTEEIECEYQKTWP